MDFINSQHLTNQDGYLHLFQDEGVYTYGTLIGGFSWSELGRIIVGASSHPIGEGEQHDIVFHWDVTNKCYLARTEDAEKHIGRYDFVMFHFEDFQAGQPPCAIIGRTDKADAFDSRRLGSRDAFTHLFMTSGEYNCQVGDSKCNLYVIDHREFRGEEYEKMIQEPAVIIVRGGSLSSNELRLVAGQTVIWAIEEGAEITIESSSVLSN